MKGRLPFVFALLGAMILILSSSCGGDKKDRVPLSDAGDDDDDAKKTAGSGELCGDVDGEIVYCDEENDYLCFAKYRGSRQGTCQHVCNLKEPKCAESEICLDVSLELPLCEETKWVPESGLAKNCVNYKTPGICTHVEKVGEGEACGLPEPCPEEEPGCGTDMIRVCDEDENLTCVILEKEDGSSSTSGKCLKTCKEIPSFDENDEDWWKNPDCKDTERCVGLSGSTTGACVPKEWNTAAREESCKEKICTPGENLVCISNQVGTNRFCLETCVIDNETCFRDEQCTCRENEICHPFRGTDSEGKQIESAACIRKSSDFDGGFPDMDAGEEEEDGGEEEDAGE